MLNIKKYPNSQVFIFDKGGSARILTYAVGGTFFDLGVDNLTFQPLRGIGILKDNLEEEERKMKSSKRKKMEVFFLNLINKKY